MPDDKDLLENMNEDSMAEFDSLEGFAEIEDLSALEGIEEFQDLEDLAESGGSEIPLPDEETSESNADGIAATIGEMTGKAPDGLFEDSAPEEEDTVPAPEETAAEMEDADEVSGLAGRAPEGLFDESGTSDEDMEDADALFDAMDDISEEISVPDSDGEEINMPDDASGEVPLPDLEGEGEKVDTLDDASEEMPLPDFEEDGEKVDAPDDASGEMPLPDIEGEGEKVDAPDDASEEMPLPDIEGEGEEVDALLDALDDASEEMPLPEPETETETEVDAALDALDDILTEIPIPEEDNHADGLSEEASGEEVQEDLPEESLGEDASDLLDLLENSEDTLLEEDINEVLNIGLPETESEQGEKEPGLLKKLFGNVVNDEIAEAERQAMEQEKAAAEEKAEQDAARKEEKEAEKAEKAEQKAAKKAAKAEQKAARKAEKAAAKAEKKARKEEEAAKEEQFEVTGKLNKIGVAIIAVFTIVFLTAEILGTNIHGVSRTRRAAKSYFELGKYTQAYQEILGTNLKKKDPDTYNKIKTVMQVQRSINAYNNYNEMNYYPDALNALLRGIQRYDANLESAKKLDVVSDMDQCRAQILSLLNDEFGVSEGDAYALLALEKSQYDSQVVQLAMSR